MDGNIGIIALRRGPDNIVDYVMIDAVVIVFDAWVAEYSVRAVVLAIGGGLGLAMAADFRVAADNARLAANFSRLGFHHGFALSASLPRVIGQQATQRVLYMGERLKADEALRIGLVDEVVPLDDLLDAAKAMARAIASSAPLVVRSIRETIRGDLAALARAALARERSEQERLMQTADFAEGVKAMAERREPNFQAQ